MTDRPHSILATFAIALLAAIGAARADEPPKLIEVRKVWDQAPHNAFTDLVRFQDRWYCVFREGKSHVSPDGALRVVVSADGVRWESAALLTSPDSDLRDAKITITPDGRLMLSGAEAMHDRSRKSHQSLVWFSQDGRTWSRRHEIGDPDFWLWRVTWHDGVAYSIGYNTNPDRNRRSIRLYSSVDGRTFEARGADLLSKNSPGENTIRFQADGAAVALLRRDVYKGTPPITEQAATALVGVSRPPYREWTWKDLGVRIGGPNFLILPDGRMAAAVRLHHPTTRTALCWLDPEAGRLEEFLSLPSKGDTSYAGLAHHDGLLWISYYSAHEGKSSIYLAKVRLPTRGADQ